MKLSWASRITIIRILLIAPFVSCMLKINDAAAGRFVKTLPKPEPINMFPESFHSRVAVLKQAARKFSYQDCLMDTHFLLPNRDTYRI